MAKRVPYCNECDYITSKTTSYTTYYCKHEKATHKHLGVDKIPQRSPMWCPKRSHLAPVTQPTEVQKTVQETAQETAINFDDLNLPPELLDNLQLYAVVADCLKNDSLVDQYCRLNNIKRPNKLSAIDKAIDKACGYDANKEFVKGFVEFVSEFVYPLL